MGDNAKNSRRERENFERFTKAAGLDVLPNSIESREPPEPDILCSIEGRGPVAFELVELVDPSYAEMESIALRGRQARSVWYGKSPLDCVRMKCRDRSYPMQHPTELVVCAGESELELASPVDPTVADRAQQLLDFSVFQRVWVARLTESGDAIWLKLERTK